ncbi:DUF2325 domain-containing protein [Desulfoluna sp.]|uniref:DUF2325 domain-containing protein n=1 Tax=Desulfoluna sp. TaxID=2045199 RepID=UPI0026281A93|nr:DUF2325 domain-containing protein [Desulfoluna sp.]
MFEGILEGMRLDGAIEKSVEGMLIPHFWEIPSSLKCPVVGLGISDAEGQRILKKCGRRTKNLEPWQVHRDLMEEVGSDTPVARRVDAVLKRKFSSALAKMTSLPEERLLPFLKTAIARGDAAEALYCLAMRKGLSLETLVTVVGEAHMMGHTTAVALLAARKKELKSADQVKELKEALNVERRERRRLGRELEQKTEEAKGLRLSVETMAGSMPVLEPRVSDGKPGDADALLRERAKRREIERERDMLAREARKQQREKRKLKIRAFELAIENKTLADEVMSLAIGRPAPPLKPMLCDGRGCRTCPEQKTCSRRVLMVGGLSRMEPHYRRVAEAKGLGFEYHDGTMSGGRKVLENQVTRCDMVVCPVTCNSHNACRSVKKLCVKHNKEIRFLPTSSISALTGVLLDMPA